MREAVHINMICKTCRNGHGGIRAGTMRGRRIKAMVEPYKPIYTVKEAAGVLRINPTKVYELINTKKLPSLLLCQRKIRGSDLERFIMTYPVAEIEEGGRAQ